MWVFHSPVTYVSVYTGSSEIHYDNDTVNTALIVSRFGNYVYLQHHSLTHSLSVIHSFVRSFIRSFIRSFVRSFVRSFLPSFLPSFLRSFVPSFLRSFVPSFLRSFVRCSVSDSPLAVALWRCGAVAVAMMMPSKAHRVLCFMLYLCIVHRSNKASLFVGVVASGSRTFVRAGPGHP